MFGSKIKCQALYDLRDEYEFCSGNDLHDFFEKEIGDPAPSGRVTIDADRAADFVIAHARGIKQNSPSIAAAMEKVIQHVQSRW